MHKLGVTLEPPEMPRLEEVRTLRKSHPAAPWMDTDGTEGHQDFPRVRAGSGCGCAAGMGRLPKGRREKHQHHRAGPQPCPGDSGDKLGCPQSWSLHPSQSQHSLGTLATWHPKIQHPHIPAGPLHIPPALQKIIPWPDEPLASSPSPISPSHPTVVLRVPGCCALCTDTNCLGKKKPSESCEWAGRKLEAAFSWLCAEQVQLTISYLFPASSFSSSRLF